MANPVNVNCPADVWTKIATSVTSLVAKILDTKANVVLETYRITAAPVPADNTGANPIDASRELVFTSSAASDVYIKPVGQATVVRVDA